MADGTKSWNRPFARFVWLSTAFAIGILVERSVQYFAPSGMAPRGLGQTFAPFWETWELVNRNYVDRKAVDPKLMTRGAIAGLLDSLGDHGHTGYMSPEDFTRLQNTLEGHMEGIGARMVMRDRHLTISNTVPGSPARAAGLRPGDIMLEVSGEKVDGLAPDQVIGKVRGPAGSSVRLAIGRAGEPKPLQFEIQRAKVAIPDVTWAMLPGTSLAHVAIQSFGNQVHEQLRQSLKEARDQGAVALVVDLRGNPGGLKDQAIAVAGEFLKDGTVFIEKDAAGTEQAMAVIPGGTATELPICVLIDELTASSAEILAGAIQDHGRGKLVGRTTSGMGTVLNQYTLSDGSAVLLAIYEWLTPKGRKIWHIGVTPDVDVQLKEGAFALQPEGESVLTAAGLESMEDKQLLKAVQLLREQIRPANAAAK